MHFEINYLAARPEFIPQVAAWHHDEWAYLRPGDTIEACTARLYAELGYRQIPTTVIAFSGQQAFGSAQLIAHDMDTRMELTPWLAGVYTAAEYRGRGIGIGLDRTDYRRSTGAGCQQVISLHAQSRDILFKAWMDDD